MKKIRFTLGVFVLAGIITTIMLKPLYNADLNRQAYEKALNKQYKKLTAMMPMEKEEAKAKGKEEKEGDFPDRAAMQDFFMTMDPSIGRVPGERLYKAYKQTKLNEKSTNAIIQWNNVSSDMGGRTRSLLWDPNDATHRKVWAGAVTGGLWYNNDVTLASSPWVSVDDFWQGLSVSSIASDPNNTQTMYVGTGEAQTAIIIYRESSGRGVGIYKSTNGGTNWTLLPSTSQFAYVTDVKVRNENGLSVIYAGVVSGIYHGANQAGSPTGGLYRSIDGGLTWTQVLPNMAGLATPYAVADIEFTADGRIFIGTMPNIDGVGGATILYSDAGTPGSWTINSTYNTLISGGTDYYLPGRIMLATAPSDANVVYAIVAAGYTDGWNKFEGKYVLRSSNKGLTWNEVTYPADYNGRNWAYLAWHAFDICVDPTNANTVFIGGLDLFRTTDGGQNWLLLTDWAQMYNGGGPTYVHGDQHAIAYRPGSNTEMIFGCDGGVFYTAAATALAPYFQERNKNYSSLQFYTCDIDPMQSSQALLGGLQDNGTLLYSGSPFTITDMVSGGDGAYAFFDQDETGMFITSYYYNVYFTMNGGSLLNYIADYQSGLFVNPSDYESKHNTIYANACDPFNTTHVDELLRITDVEGGYNGMFIPLNTGTTVPYSHVKVSQHSTLFNTMLFIGTQSGRLFKVTNANSTPVVSEIGDPSFPNAAISCVAIGGSNDTLMVTFSNYGVPSIWQTFNGGVNWQSIENNLPDMPVRWAIYHPGNSNQALIATETGVWSCGNLHNSNPWWTPAVTGMANVRVDMLKIRNSDSKVVAASHGRGLFTGTFNLDPTSSTSTVESSSFNVYPNPSSGDLFVESSSMLPLTFSVYSTSGQLILENTTFEASTRKAIDLHKLKPGMYMVDIQQGNNRVSKKIVIQ